MKAVLQILLAGLSALSLVSCAATQSANKSFLSDYSGMTQKSQFEDKVTYEGGLSKLPNYNKIYLEEVKVFPPKDMEKREITQADLARTEKSFRSALASEVRKTRFGLASGPGPQTLSLRAGITDLLPGNPALFAAGYAPYVGSATTAAGAVTGSKMGRGSATVEAEVLDSVTRERLLAVIDENAGTKLQVVEGMTRWGHIDKALEEWSEGLRKRLQGE